MPCIKNGLVNHSSVKAKQLNQTSWECLHTEKCTSNQYMERSNEPKSIPDTIQQLFVIPIFRESYTSVMTLQQYKALQVITSSMEVRILRHKTAVGDRGAAAAQRTNQIPDIDGGILRNLVVQTMI